jgi:uncharacterized protein (DUF58 family)
MARAVSLDELYALGVAAVLFPLLAMALVRIGRHRVQIVREVHPRRAFAGGRMRVEVAVSNLGRLPTPPLLLEDDAPHALGGPVRLVLSSLPTARDARLVSERKPARRGRYTLGPMRARLVDPFGLAATTAEVAPVHQVLVYPRIEHLAEEGPPAERTEAGRSLVYRLAPQGDEFYGIREWQDGDDLRKIHWRSVARTGDLMIRQDESRFFPRATVLLDTRAGAHRGRGEDASIEWAISAAASAVWELAHDGYVVRLATADEGPGPARWGREGWDRHLEELADVKPAPSRTMLPVLRRLGAQPGAGGALLAFLAAPDAEALGALARARRAYEWCGAVLLDVDSFTDLSARQRAEADQRLADAGRALARAGWRVATAGAHDRFKDVWRTLLVIGVLRPSSPSPRS